MQRANFLHTYSEAVLQFSLQGEEQALVQEQAFADNHASFKQADIEMHCARMLRFAKKGNKKYFVLFGIGQVPALLHALHTALQPQVTMLVCEQSPAIAQVQKACLQTPEYIIPLLADSSQWAHLMLLAQCGVTAANTSFFINPCQSNQAQEQGKQLQQFVTGVQHATVPYTDNPAAQLGVGAIIHPYDKGLQGFFRQIPAWVRQVHVVWHAGAEQEQQNSAYMQHLAAMQQQASLWCKAPVQHTVRALNNDFAAQRNAMLEPLHTPWVLYIDADERFTPQAWHKLACLLQEQHKQHEECSEVCAWAFERRTFFPDHTHVRVGRGLWPDIQLRLFKKTAATRFIQPVHEKVIGLGGQLGLCSAIPLYHLSYLLKDAAAQKERLAVFDTARSTAVQQLRQSQQSQQAQQADAETAVFHKVQEYPVLARGAFEKAFADNKNQLNIMVLQGQLP